MKKHQYLQEDLVSYLMGELNADERGELEEHLRGCTDCQILLEEYRQTLSVIDAIPEVEPPADFTQQVLQAARAAQEQQKQHELQQQIEREVPFAIPVRPRRFGLPYRLARFVSLACIVLIILIAGTVLGPQGKISDDSDLPKMGNNDLIISQNYQQKTDVAADVATEPTRPEIAETAVPDDLSDFQVEVPPLSLSDPAYTQIQLPTNFRQINVRRSQVTNPAFAVRLDWRQKEKALSQAALGRPTSFAIIRGLWWLARHQDADGKWDAANFAHECDSRFCKNDTQPQLSNEGVTAAALLAMLGDGNTPTTGKFRAHVARGIQWLQSRQRPDGAIGQPSMVDEHFLLEHALATAALAEAYAMTAEPKYRKSAQLATNYLQQHPVPLLTKDDKLNTEYIGTAAVRMAALDRAAAARLDVPRNPGAETARMFAKINAPASSVLAYPWPSTAVQSRITAGMLALLGETDDVDTSMLAGELPRLRAHLPDWSENGQLYWVCGSEIAKKADGKFWQQWSQELQKTLVQHQERTGHAMGSWDPRDKYSALGGRVFSTALAVLALETPYR